MRRIVKIGLVGLGLTLIALKACSLSSGSIDGVVLDEATGKPVADAIVVVTWTGDWTKIFGESSSACYHVETARSDANGKYHIEGWWRPWDSSNLRVSAREPLFEAYKSGYTRPRKSSDKFGTVLIAPFRGTKDEYFSYLDRLASSNYCAFGDESRRNLYRLYAPLAEEAKSIAEGKRQNNLVEKLVFYSNNVLVNRNKTTTRNSEGRTINLNPNDNYSKEELLK